LLAEFGMWLREATVVMVVVKVDVGCSASPLVQMEKGVCRGGVGNVDSQFGVRAILGRLSKVVPFFPVGSVQSRAIVYKCEGKLDLMVACVEPYCWTIDMHFFPGWVAVVDCLAVSFLASGVTIF
jgi:hypothetical protein